jgi:DNA-binding response OmpR family regulator
MADASPPHVVILEDSLGLATAFGRVFTGADYRVSTLIDCAVAPAKVLAMLPDLVLLDLQGGDGLRGMRFLRDLRADPAGQDLPVIAAPTFGWFDQRVLAPELLILRADLLPDPFTIGDLLAAARAAVERARDVRQRADIALARMHRIVDKLPPV